MLLLTELVKFHSAEWGLEGSWRRLGNDMELWLTPSAQMGNLCGPMWAGHTFGFTEKSLPAGFKVDLTKLRPSDTGLVGLYDGRVFYLRVPIQGWKTKMTNWEYPMSYDFKKGDKVQVKSNYQSGRPGSSFTVGSVYIVSEDYNEADYFLRVEQDDTGNPNGWGPANFELVEAARPKAILGQAYRCAKGYYDDFLKESHFTSGKIYVANQDDDIMVHVDKDDTGCPNGWGTKNFIQYDGPYCLACMYACCECDQPGELPMTLDEALSEIKRLKALLGQISKAAEKGSE